MADNGATVKAATMVSGRCGIRFICDACGGSGCDHCGDTGKVACPCAAGGYVHGAAETGETCTECGETFGTGMDILRSDRVPAPGGPAYLRDLRGWHVGCR